MKKIVALVLSLVMVMGLATTAFAADDYKVYENDTDFTMVGDINEDQASVFTKVPGKAPKMGDNLSWVAGAVEYYTATFTDGVTFYFYEVADKDDATHIIKNGKTVYMYVAKMMNADEAAYTYTATASKNTAMNDSECGKVDISDWALDSTLYTYVDDLGDVQYATDDANATGATVRLNADGVVDDYTVVTVNPHTFYPTYTKGDVSGATCGKCGLVASRVKSAASLPAKFVEITTPVCNGEFAGCILYYVPGAAASAGAAADSTVVESAQTFDAGIAMYVGMSVMAAAGSAVVLKKKD